MKKYQKPMCSDGYSNFIVGSDKEHNEELEEATAYLLEKSIPNFAQDLMSFEVVLPAIYEDFPLIQTLHTNGINVRYLGLLRHCILEETFAGKHWRRHILLEIINRTLKQEIRRKGNIFTSRVT